MRNIGSPPSIYVTGGWGYGNRGDNAILAGTLKLLEPLCATHQLVLTSFSPDEVSISHGLASARSAHKTMVRRSRVPQRLSKWIDTDKFSPELELYINDDGPLPSELLAQYRMIESSELVIFAGGGYFNDQWRSMLLSQLALIKMASSAGRPMAILGQTLGPFSDAAIEQYLRKYLPLVDKVLVRDIGSAEIARKAGVEGDRLRIVADMATLVPVKAKAPRLGGKKLVGVMIQNFRHSYGTSGRNSTSSYNRVQYEDAIIEVLTKVNSRAPRFICIPSTTWDENVLDRIYRRMREAGMDAEILRDPTFGQYIEACQSVDVMLSTNMHPIILASTAGAPSVALSYSFKVDNYMASIGLGEYVHPIDAFDPSIVGAGIIDHLDNQSARSDSVASELNKLSALASSALGDIRSLVT